MLKNKKMPSLFIGHGSPENAFELNEFSKTWKEIASLFSKPEAIIIISAHWTNYMSDKVDKTSIVTAEKPETIHDFYGFPENFYKFFYTAPGYPELAKKIVKFVKTVDIKESNDWGLDHGAWSVLAQMYPEANIPVLQISIDENLSRKELFEIGKELARLREEGILIIGSGNIVHNLREVNWNGSAYEWASEFDKFIKIALEKNNYDSIINFEKHPFANLALPTVEHFLPLLYVVGSSEEEIPKFFCEKIFASSISMRCVAYGIE
jgi:4,5-DOPA dioxygenase extradiol